MFERVAVTWQGWKSTRIVAPKCLPCNMLHWWGSKTPATTQERKDRQVDSLGFHWRCGSLPSTSPVDPRLQGSWGQHGAHLGPVGPRWAPCWPHEPCYQGYQGCHHDDLSVPVQHKVTKRECQWYLLFVTKFGFAIYQVPVVCKEKKNNGLGKIHNHSEYHFETFDNIIIIIVVLQQHVLCDCCNNAIMNICIHCWPRVRNIFCVKHKLETFMRLIFLMFSVKS